MLHTVRPPADAAPPQQGLLQVALPLLVPVRRLPRARSALAARSPAAAGAASSG